MFCKDCEYCIDKETYTVCQVCHRINLEGCTYSNIENLKICFNCKHWLGSGDFGLSCRKNYYMTTTNGFTKACDNFEYGG